MITPPPKRPQQQSHPHFKPNYGQRVQYSEEEDDPPLSKAEQKYVQEVIGIFLYYACAVNITMLTALGYLDTQQAAPTQNLGFEFLFFISLP